MYFDWKTLDNEDEVAEEVIDGLKELSRDNILTLVSSLIWEMSFEWSDITKRIEEVDNCHYSLPDDDEQCEPLQ